MATRRPIPADKLSRLVNDVLVTTAKSFKASRPDSKGNLAEAVAAMEKRIPAAVEEFNAVLDDTEFDILLAKSVLQRDLDQLRAMRKPPAPEPKPVAPPAPMVIDLESPSMASKEPFTDFPGPLPPGKQDGKPVAPFPNMGFEAASPELTLVPSPKTAPKPKDVKNLSRPAMSIPAAGRPSTAPPKKEAKAHPAQVARPGGVATAPQTPLNPPMQAKTSPLPAPTRPAPATAPGNAPVSAAAASSVPPPAGNENLFTDIAFSLAPPPSRETQTQKQASQPPTRLSQQQQAQPPGTDAANAGGGGMGALNLEQQFTEPLAEAANVGLGVQSGRAGEDNGMSSAEARIDELFDLGPGGIDLEYDLSNGDSSNFNDMYFPSNDSAEGAGDFDDAFFNLNG